MRCRDVMQSDVKCIGETASIDEAAVLMRDAGIGFLPICDRTGRVLGTLTDRDIAVRAVAGRCGRSTSVLAIMTRHALVACRPDDDLAVAEDHMARAKVLRILVVDDDFRLAGVISLSDLAQHDRERAVATLNAIARRDSRPSAAS